MECIKYFNIAKINLASAKKNHQIDFCHRNFENARNGLIIIDSKFETLTFFPDAYSYTGVKGHLKYNTFRKYPSMMKCLHSLDKQKTNIIIIAEEGVYLMDTDDSLVFHLFDPRNIYHTVLEFEFNANKISKEEKTNHCRDIKFQYAWKIGENIYEIKDRSVRRKRIMPIIPREKKIRYDEVPTETIPLFRVKNNIPLITVINNLDSSFFLNGNCLRYGDIVSDNADTTSLALTQTSNHATYHQTQLREYVGNHVSLNNNSQTHRQQADKASNSELIQRTEELNSQVRSSESMTGASNNGATSIIEFTLNDKIRSPQLQTYSMRLSTFARWPTSMMQKPDQVAEAGFYYTGLEDVVRCFACDGGLKSWHPEDDPWIKHARWFPRCPYVLKVKGPEYIDLVGRMVDEEEDSTVRSSFQRESLMTDLPCLGKLSIGDQAGTSQMETDAADTVIQMGYSRKAVTMAIEGLINKGMRQYTTQDIMTVIQDKEDRGESLPEDDDSFQACSPTPNFYSNKDTIMQQNESLKSSITCKKCKERKRNILFLPCTHHCLCQACAETSLLCPICSRTINERIKTYMI